MIAPLRTSCKLKSSEGKHNFCPGLLLALPRLRKLYFANMKAVMEELLRVKNMSKSKEELSMDKEEISKEKEENGTTICGPFLLEHFDSSEYSLAVPGEGTRPEVRAVWKVGEGFTERPNGLTLAKLRQGNLYHSEVRIIKNCVGSLFI